MRSFVIESNGNFLGEIGCLWTDSGWGYDMSHIDIDSRPVVLAEHGQKQHLVQVVGVTDPDGETLTPSGETEACKAMVYYGVKVTVKTD